MSDSSIHSRLNSDALVCEEPLVSEPLPPEAPVCEKKAEYHEDTINKVCDPEVMVVVEYKESEKSKTGFEEIVRVDEQKALAKRASTFEQKPKMKKLPKKQKKQPKVAQKSETKEGVQSPQPLPHSHEETIAASSNPESQRELTPTLQSLPLPAQASELPCYCGYVSNGNRPSVSARQMVSTRDLETLGAEAPRAAQAIVFGSLFVFGEKGPLETSSADAVVVSHILSSLKDAVVTSRTHDLFSQLPIKNQEGFVNRKTDEPETAYSPANSNSLPTMFVSFDYYYLKRSRSVDGSEPTPLGWQPQGGMFLVGHSETLLIEPTAGLIVLPPSWVTPRQSGTAGLSGLATEQDKPTYLKVRRGSDAHNSRDSHQQGGGESHGQQRRFS